MLENLPEAGAALAVALCTCVAKSLSTPDVATWIHFVRSRVSPGGFGSLLALVLVTSMWVFRRSHVHHTTEGLTGQPPTHSCQDSHCCSCLWDIGCPSSPAPRRGRTLLDVWRACLELWDTLRPGVPAIAWTPLCALQAWGLAAGLGLAVVPIGTVRAPDTPCRCTSP